MKSATVISILAFLVLCGCNTQKYSCDLTDIKQTARMWWRLEYIFTTKDNISLFIGNRYEESHKDDASRAVPAIYEPEVVAIDTTQIPISQDVEKGDYVYFDTRTNTMKKRLPEDIKTK